MPLTEKVSVPVGSTAAPEEGVTAAVRVTACPVTGLAGLELTWVLVAKKTTCQVYEVAPRAEL